MRHYFEYGPVDKAMMFFDVVLFSILALERNNCTIYEEHLISNLEWLVFKEELIYSV